MKKIIWILILMWVFALPVSAENVYREQYEQSGAASLEGALPQETRQQLNRNGIDPSRADWVDGLTAESVFAHIADFLKKGAKAPLAAGAISVALMLVAAALPKGESHSKLPTGLAVTLGVALSVALPMISSVRTAASAMKGCGTFMLSFVPVFTGVCVASGGSFTAVSVQALLLLAAQVVVSAASYTVLPFTGSYLAMNLCAGISPLAGVEQTAEMLRKVAVWGITLITTVFVGILSIQTAVHSATDSLALKTTKFIVGTAVPVAGQALSEATSTVYASLGLLRSSVGVFGVVALAAILLPILAELLVWRLTVTICGQVATVFGENGLQKFFKAVDQMFSLLLTVVLLTGGVFIIALSVTLTALRAL